MAGPKKKEAAGGKTPARSALKSLAVDETQLESAALDMKKTPAKKPQPAPSSGVPDKKQSQPDDADQRRAKTSQNIVPAGHGSMWQQLKTLFLCKTPKESIEVWGGVVLRGEQMPKKSTRASKVRYYQAFGLNPNAQ